MIIALQAALWCATLATSGIAAPDAQSRAIEAITGRTPSTPVRLMHSQQSRPGKPSLQATDSVQPQPGCGGPAAQMGRASTKPRHAMQACIRSDPN